MPPSPGSLMPDWWLLQRNRIGKEHRKGFDSVFVLTCWLLWKERNAHVFNHASMSAPELSDWIRQVGRQWKMEKSKVGINGTFLTGF
jgi:hypothetical protein